MMRKSLAMWSLFAVLGVAVAAWLVVADDKQPKGQKPAEKKELIDTFLQSLKPTDGRVTEQSDRCPGETAADRSDDEMAPVTTPEEAEKEPSDDAASAELTDEPKTLPDVPEIKPLKPGDKPVGPVVGGSPALTHLNDLVRATLGLV
jgi:hypothetical protein